jgi:hypothetical protein
LESFGLFVGYGKDENDQLDALLELACASFLHIIESGYILESSILAWNDSITWAAWNPAHPIVVPGCSPQTQEDPLPARSSRRNERDHARRSAGASFDLHRQRDNQGTGRR